jgi:two-component system response regulator PilR (NtrC family)
MTAYGSIETAVEAMRHGAHDYLTKPFKDGELVVRVQNALARARLATAVTLFAGEFNQRHGLSALVGTSAALRELTGRISRVAASDATVLVEGESGTGKELVARALHNLSPRSGSPFVAINCAALAEGVLESELFGHMRGAFTGAHADHQGILVQAGDGTVLLDEIGELSPGTQVKLLRVLQERRVRPVGSSKEVPFEARVLAATNRELEADVKSGRFRQDLLFRLNVITLELKPLRARREDIEPLAKHFLTRVAQELGRPQLRFADETMRLLREFPFSGNVRQLQNIVERAATLSDADLLDPDTLPPAVLGRGDEAGGTEVLQLAEGFSLERHMDTLERRYLSFALARAGGVKTRAAELLGLSFRSLRYRLAKHGLDERDERQGPGKAGA